ncbi:uncharacterized protein si:dkey-250k15.4 isoform X1 [Hippoglossus stenolepis]|uniref:uncharacterized protein si:dkey-250k15.4 isoform X1 n=2 Tax=Hippoglossus stenolepis TaxID=195615 RepID=UPI001FAE96E2|nr:uncharacterized protein si:dkey-250k15.4 isoform X1 [Hippoglossus stenolepis]
MVIDFTRRVNKIQANMSHTCVRDSSTKENKPSDTTYKRCCSVNRFPADCKCLIPCKTDGQPKIKRLKTRKERSQMKGAGKEASKTKSYHQHCHCQTSKGREHFHNFCHGICNSRRDAPFSKVITATQEPSIITESRLIGHHGLFNHEVKSIDIQRLLSQQGRLETGGQEAQEENHPSLTPHIPSPFSSKDLLEAGTDEVLPFERKEDGAAKTRVVCQEKEKPICHESDITPGQRPQQQLDLSSESYKSIFSSKHSSPEVIISEEVTSVIHEKEREFQLTPTVDRDIVKRSYKKVKKQVISTPRNQEPPAQQTHARHLSPSQLQLSSSPTTNSFLTQHRRRDPGCISKCVSAVGARLCDCLQFPRLRSRNLLAESREVLLKALQERHGARLQENLLYQQRRRHFDTDPNRVQDHDQEPTMTDTHELSSTDASAFQGAAVGEPCSDTTALREMRSKHFNLKSSLKPQQSRKWNADSLKSPVDASARLSDDILRLSSRPQFRMNVERDYLFTSSPTSCWGDKASASQQWDVGLNRAKCNESVIFDSFDNSISDHTRALREKSCGPQYNDTKPLFPYQTQLRDRHSAGPMHFPQEQHPFQPDRFSFTPSFSSQIHHPNLSSIFQPFNQSSPALTCPPISSYHTDMIHYPPSHVLERGPAPRLSSLPSPELWSFPPMKLY